MKAREMCDVPAACELSYALHSFAPSKSREGEAPAEPRRQLSEAWYRSGEPCATPPLSPGLAPSPRLALLRPIRNAEQARANRPVPPGKRTDTSFRCCPTAKVSCP